MNRLIGVLLACAAIAGGVSVAEARQRQTPQQRLDSLLAGRVAGTPVDCISLMDSNTTQIISGIAIVYGSGRRIFVNTPDNASSLRGDPILVTRIRGSSQLCRMDTVQLRDRSSRMFSGFVTLNKFVPYTRTGN
jgi:hypothetical protein